MSTVYRKDYQPPEFDIKTVDLDIELYEDHALVTNQMSLSRKTESTTLRLFGDELTLVNCQMNGVVLEKPAYDLVEGNLVILNCPEVFILTVVTKIYPKQNSKLSGLYCSNQLFCTQCEAEGFRRITFYLDKPDTLAVFTTRISADKKKYPILLSNGNLVKQGEGEDNRHWAIWHDPFKKPSYLFALVAGDLALLEDSFVTASKKTISLKLYVEPHNRDKGSHALASLKEAMRWDEIEFGREYDLDVYMIVAVSDFNMGAMENKGLNLFNAKYVLASPASATDEDYENITEVIAHEYFHNWTGNRITCRDWFQLSLKEGLTVYRNQEFMQDYATRDLMRIQDVKLLRRTQFPEDASSMAHPVRPESYEEINNFYTATVYNKGAEVIRMMRILVGKTGFRKGMDLYFTRNDGKAVTIDEFVACIEEANGVELTQFKRWYSQAGTPIINVYPSFDSTRGMLTVKLVQSCPKTNDTKEEKQAFHIPINMALFSQEGELITEEVLVLTKHEQTFNFKTQTEPVISLLRDFSAPVKIDWEQSVSDLLHLLKFETNGFAKWEAAQTLALNWLKTYLYTNPVTWDFPITLTEAYKHVLTDESLNQGTRSALLCPPDFEALTNELNEIDVEQVEKVRDFYRRELGRNLFVEASQLYERLHSREDHAMDETAFNRRRLKNQCLWLAMKGDENRALFLCTKQFKHAKTMTDKLSSFILLVNSEDMVLRKEAIDQFYENWKDNDLVLDKWFAAQATIEQPQTLSLVEALLLHPDFTFSKPNKVRALIGSFTQSNPRHFHAIDGSGYQFLTEMLLHIDKLNPQIAARLSLPFTRWQRLNEPRQQLIIKELERLARHTLSKDLKEIVTKSLKG